MNAEPHLRPTRPRGRAEVHTPKASAMNTSSLLGEGVVGGWGERGAQPSRHQPWYAHRHLSSRSPKSWFSCPPEEGFGLLVAVSWPRDRGWGSPMEWPPAKLVEAEPNVKQEVEGTAALGLREREDQRLCGVTATHRTGALRKPASKRSLVLGAD